MGDAGLRGCDRGDLSRIQMNAMTEYSVRGKQSAFFVDMSVIARTHIKVMHFFQLFAIFRQVCL